MQADLPLFEGPEDAIRAAVLALGGSKHVGPMLWPDKGADASSRLLLDCINPARAEKLDLSQTILILRAARDLGCYAPFQWIAGEIGFDATPITKAEELDRVASVIADATKTLAASISTLERLQKVRAVA